MKELIITNDVLFRCETDEKTVTIPPQVDYVFTNAFDTCPDVNIINLNHEYIVRNLTEYITKFLKDVVKGWDSENYSPCFPVYHIDESLVDKAVEKAKTKVETKYPGTSLKVHTIAADKLAKLLQSKQRGYDVADLYNLPVDEKNNEYGILYIKGISKENIDSLGGNFAYNLFRSHSLFGNTLSDKWLVVLSSDTRLDASDSISAFSPQSCWMSSPKEYLDYMDGRNRVLDVEYGCFHDTYKVETNILSGQINLNGGWVIGPFFKMPQVGGDTKPSDIVLSGDCRHEEQTANKFSRMGFTLTADGILTISGNDWLCAVYDVELSPNPVLEDEIDAKPFQQSMFKDLDFHTVVIEKGVPGLRKYSLAGCKNLKQIVINIEDKTLSKEIEL